MAGQEIDYAAVFRALPSPVLLLTPDFVIADANSAYLQVAGRGLEELLGRTVSDAFPDNPADPGATGVRNLSASLRRVAETGQRDTMALQRYDVEVAGSAGVFEERYWSPVNTPVLGPAGQVVLIVHRVEEVTGLVRLRGGPGADSQRQAMESELYVRAQELQDLNERLREAHAREREVALTLQQAMLPALTPIEHADTAVRYRPAATALNVCGDWYDLVDLPGKRVGVAVGDVVGHGLSAAGVMGQLRSALSAAVRVADGPAQALDALELYARSVQGAESTTAVQAVADCQAHTIAYSCAGHPPPALVDADGGVVFLDGATDPPLGARPEHVLAAQASTTYATGDTLVLYTDGLIERRGEDIDAGLSRLAHSLARHRELKPEALADALLADLGVMDEATDDTALVVIRL